MEAVVVDQSAAVVVDLLEVVVDQSAGPLEADLCPVVVEEAYMFPAVAACVCSWAGSESAMA